MRLFLQERNAATLLLGTLITRTFGVLRTKDHINLTVHNKMTGKAFFETHTGLLSFMLDKLYNFITEDNELINSNIQPILLIASRLYSGNASKKRTDFSWKVCISKIYYKSLYSVHIIGIISLIFSQILLLYLLKLHIFFVFIHNEKCLTNNRGNSPRAGAIQENDTCFRRNLGAVLSAISSHDHEIGGHSVWST